MNDHENEHADHTRRGRPSASKWVHVTVDRIERVTPMALLVTIGDEEYWLPKSQISEANKYEEGDEDLTLSITEWIAEQKDIEGDD